MAGGDVAARLRLATTSAMSMRQICIRSTRPGCTDAAACSVRTRWRG